MNLSALKEKLLEDDPGFWPLLRSHTRQAADFEELFFLSSLRKKAEARGVPRLDVASQTVRLAALGGCNLYPFRELLSHLCAVEGLACDLWVGEFDNYVAEIAEDTSGLYRFTPEIVVLLPSESRCVYPGKLTDARELQQAEAARAVGGLLGLAATIHGRSRAEIILTNFMLPRGHDLGAYRCRTLGSDWSFRKWVNLELGLAAPACVHICDLEFLAYRRGGLSASDERAWFESKQPCSPALLVDLAREVAHMIASLRCAPRKVLALDLDNTLWGGVVADDGLEGIELGDTSARGQAFKAFQRYVRTLGERGVLLAVCSKNEHRTAAEVFEKHPEMLLRLDDFASFKADWEPKPDNLRRIASELNLGLDSFVFVDDNPSEVEAVRQFAPEVATILVGPDPASYVAQLQDCRLFEPRSMTVEDSGRATQYRAEAQRQTLAAAVTDMPAYLESLAMEAVIAEFTAADVPRLAQLINKSNQFNLTTRRRTEAELLSLMRDRSCVGFSVRLMDRFGDHGLISVVIAQQTNGAMEIDTWLMSCRVLKREVEHVVLNELARLDRERGCVLLEGVYLPTAKNGMVRDFYPSIGFALRAETERCRRFGLPLERFEPLSSKIRVTRHAYEPS